MVSIGTKIKKLRIAMELTQEQLADFVGTKKQTIHKYETGIISNIPASKIKALADALNTTPAYLMGWNEDTDETIKKEDAVSDIFLRLRKDEKFLDAVQRIYNLNDKQLDAVIIMLSSFEQN